MRMKGKGNLMPGGPDMLSRVRSIPVRWVVLFVLAVAVSCGSVIETEKGSVKSVMNSMDGEPVVPRKANRIFVPDFSNRSGRESIQTLLTLKLRKFIYSGGRLALVESRENADLLLQGEVTSFTIEPVQYSVIGVPVKKRMRMAAKVTLTDASRGKVIFLGKSVQAFEEYSDNVPPVVTEESAKEKIIDALAQRITAQVESGWYTELMTPEERGK